MSLKVTLRTLKDENLVFMVTDTTTVDDLKGLVFEKHQHEKGWQRLIYDGAVLENDTVISSLNLKPQSFIVLMVKKPRVKKTKAAAKAVEPAKTQPTPVPEKKDAPSLTPAAPAADPAAAPAVEDKMEEDKEEAKDDKKDAEKDAKEEDSMDVDETPATQPAENLFGNVDSEMVENLSSMGFAKDQVILALNAAFNNPERAVEYLTSGMPIPQPAPQPVAPQPAAPTTAGGAGGAAPAAAGGMTASTQDFLEAFRSRPEFLALRQVIAQDPRALEQLLLQLAQTNPEIVEEIAQNQDAFVELLTGPLPEGTGQPQPTPPQVLQPGGADGPQITRGPNGSVQIHVTPQDLAAINQLVDMGFDKTRAMEAYFVFQKDLDAAANYLFSNPDELEGDQMDVDDTEAPTDF
eukprot:TRINITY_DN13145_c0_g1_i1.p1 TRINITY_DN13145_c0_g1~~TRINITY_DN13145_c0_g1_i1.p1  ORF type:complete len:417 (-),score=145.52 TRINITY_DN13145_c0_g1_i1:160-1377(-)